jgi:hypothetical protein
MKGKIEEEIINLDVEKIDFDDKELLKRLFLLLLNRIEFQAQEIQLLNEQIQLLYKPKHIYSLNAVFKYGKSRVSQYLLRLLPSLLQFYLFAEFEMPRGWAGDKAALMLRESIYLITTRDIHRSG